MTQESEIPEENWEKLLAVFHPARISFLYMYILGLVFFIFGWLFNISVAAGVVPYDERAWWLGMSSMAFGLLLVAGGEYRKRYTAYIVTTWNLRVRKGSYNKITTRVFYDEIESFEIKESPEARVVNLGALCVYTKDEQKPTLVFRDIHNPKGMLELVTRIKKTTSDPVPWLHIEKTRIVKYS